MISLVILFMLKRILLLGEGGMLFVKDQNLAKKVPGLAMDIVILSLKENTIGNQQWVMSILISMNKIFKFTLSECNVVLE